MDLGEVLLSLIGVLVDFCTFRCRFSNYHWLSFDRFDECMDLRTALLMYLNTDFYQENRLNGSQLAKLKKSIPLMLPP